MAVEEYGIEGLAPDDSAFAGSRFADVREAIFANPYPRPFERFPVTLGSVLHIAGKWLFLAAARRSVKSQADLRWGPDRKGYRRLLHPNGICLTGTWSIDEPTEYSGYFRNGSRGLVVGRYSTCCTETRRGHTRSLALVGRVYPTVDPNHPEKLPTASFITQQDIGGEKTVAINDAILLNAPNTSIWRRGFGIPILLITAVVLRLADKQPTMRQVYQVAELGKPPSEPTRSPQFLRFRVSPHQPAIDGDALDFRDEILMQIERHGKLTFDIETSDTGKSYLFGQLRKITNWRRIGSLTFTEAVASFNGDRVVHFNHPKWRQDLQNQIR
jgi:hypothetical protein